MENKFDNIRPYNQDEFLDAMQRVAESPILQNINDFIYPGSPVELLQQRIKNFKNVDEFQSSVMYDGIKRIIDLTTSSFTWSGTEKLDKNLPYLFISNHRDIMLDPSLLDWCLFSNKRSTVEISFGDNLLSSMLFVDIARSNKMFKVIRSCSMKEMLLNSKLLSEYIREAITQRNSSVWLAQRNGRTKDGLDATDQGILKMLSLSNPTGKAFIEGFAELNIVPMAISYEIEPCDIMKARETLIKKNEGTYVKQEGEDDRSVMSGLTQQKGRVHISFADPITIADLDEYSDQHVNILNHSISELLDKRIRSSYMLMPSNYIAHDILHHENKYADQYTPEQRKSFEEYLDQQLSSQPDLDQSQLREIMLDIYATCVDSYFNSSRLISKGTSE